MGMNMQFNFIKEDNNLDVRWNNNFRQIQTLFINTGTITPCVKSQRTLNNWLNAQRRAYKEGTLKHNRFESLQMIGFNFERQINTWSENFGLLTSYKEKNGHCDVPNRGANLTASHLGNWVQSQREYYRLGTLSKKHIVMLESIGFKWLINDNVKNIHGSIKGYAA
jgi:hypothetical protein